MVVVVQKGSSVGVALYIILMGYGRASRRVSQHTLTHFTAKLNNTHVLNDYRYMIPSL